MKRYKDMLSKEYEKFKNQESSKYPNIMVVGKSGAGKSSLINFIFRRDLAKVSDTEPCTMGYKIYKGKDYKNYINIIDTEGYELSVDENKDSLNNYKEKLNNMLSEINEEIGKVNIVWFCISVAGNRIEDMDISILDLIYSLNELNKNVFLVLTKCDEDDEDGTCAKEFKNIIKKYSNDRFKNIKIFEVSNNNDVNKIIEEECKISGIKSLLSESANAITDEDVRVNFIKSQKNNLDLKKAQAEKIISLAAVSAGAIGLTPIPMSDSITLVPIQLTMIAKITSIYDMDSNESVISKALVSNLIISQLGKLLATQLLKLIPFGSLINGGVASSITYALGSAISEIYYSNSEKILNGEFVDMNNMFDEETVKQLFNEFMSKKEV